MRSDYFGCSIYPRGPCLAWPVLRTGSGTFSAVLMAAIAASFRWRTGSSFLVATCRTTKIAGFRPGWRTVTAQITYKCRSAGLKAGATRLDWAETNLRVDSGRPASLLCCSNLIGSGFWAGRKNGYLLRTAGIGFRWSLSWCSRTLGFILRGFAIVDCPAG